MAKKSFVVHIIAWHKCEIAKITFIVETLPMKSVFSFLYPFASDTNESSVAEHRRRFSIEGQRSRITSKYLENDFLYLQNYEKDLT